MNSPVNIFWFRRDLRLEDNAGLYKALQSGRPVLPIFIFDTEILNKLEDYNDARIHFIHNALTHINEQLQKYGSSLLIFHGKPVEIWQELLANYPVEKVFVNRDYEPYAKERDEAVKTLLNQNNIEFFGAKDQVIFEKNEVVKADGKPYHVFTPYSRAWKKRFETDPPQQYPSEDVLHNHLQTTPFHQPSLEELNFKPTDVPFPPHSVEPNVLQQYHDKRNYPSLNATSRMGPHLRFGTISIRQLLHKGLENSNTYTNELIWRDFYQMILWYYPQVADQSFKPEFDNIQWINSEADFKKWCEGKTGYPLVDAGMRQLNTIGYMHNRVRMVTASFLTKHLLIDWRWGERYFAKQLLDYELASNNGGWQWAAGTGVDAAPYFRIFNPQRQIERFDPNYEYIRYWVPEYGTKEYPEPMIDHKFARQRALNTYQEALNKAKANS